MNKIENLITAYMNGYFPMADAITNEIYFYSPSNRAIFPIFNIKTPRSLKQYIKKNTITTTINKNFPFIINACANRKNTWISDEIIDLYIKLHKCGIAHSIESWYDGQIVGGLYGVSIGGAFFGESMYSNISNASKVAFYFLIEHLKKKRFELLDSQFINEHTKLLGAIEVSREEYLKKLKYAIKLERFFM